MLEKIVNSMIYGNAKTKLFFWSVFLLGIAAVALLLVGIVLQQPYLAMGGVGVGLVAFIVSQSVSLNDLKKATKKKEKKPKEPKESKEPQEPAGQKDVQQAQKQAEETPREEKTRAEREKEKTRYWSTLSEKRVKKLLKEHKVNQIHVMGMIDSYPAKRIEQVPAFIWRTDTMLHFLALTDQAEEFEVPLEEIQGILLVKNVPADKEHDYRFFQFSSVISKMFQPYLPEYFEGTKDGKLAIHKNTFRIEPGIYLTNSSVANLYKVLLPGVAFLVDDKVIESRRFNEYFKELYRYSLLCKNMVITLEEYREQTKKTLDALLDAPIEGKEFVNTIYDLNKYHLIQKEDVVYYTQKYRELKL